MIRPTLTSLTVALAVAGCASAPEGPDTTPAQPTAVLESSFSSDGIKGFVPMAGTNRTFTRPDMRREDGTLKGTGTVTRFLVGNKETARIERLDRKVVWTLDPPEKTYTECPITGCVTPSSGKPARPEQPSKPEEPRSSSGECTPKIAKSDFKVVPTGQKSTINGFPADQYQLSWVVVFTDPKARSTVSTLAVDVWTTPVTPEIRDAVAMEQTYEKAFVTAMLGDQNLQAAMAIVPEEALQMIGTYLASTFGSTTPSALLKASSELEKMQGFPIRRTVTWNLKGDACADAQAAAADEPESSSIPTGAGDVISKITEYFIRKEARRTMQEAEGKPILSFTTEVKSFRIEPVKDSTFTPPKTFKQVSLR